MVADLNLDLEIKGLATVREADGLAMSSRNVYLKEEERKSALQLSRSLQLAQKLYAGGEKSSKIIIAAVTELIKSVPYTDIDYVKICDTENLADVENIIGESVIALAVRVGATRLIDNHVFGEYLKF